MKFLQVVLPVLCIFAIGACDKESEAPTNAPAPTVASASALCSSQQKADLRSLELVCQQSNNNSACQAAAAAYKSKYADSLDCLTSVSGGGSGAASSSADYPACSNQVTSDFAAQQQTCSDSGSDDSTACQAAIKAFNAKYADLRCQGRIGDSTFSICNSTQGDCPDED